jgi:hypothetical protein
MRGSKGNKYYQSNKAVSYYDNKWCSLGCKNTFISNNITTIFNTIPPIGKQTIGVDNAWQFKSEWNHGSNNYFLINYLTGVRHPLTREQAQTPDQIRQDYDWYTRENSEAKPLAIQLGLAS